MFIWFFQKNYLHLSIKKIKMVERKKYFYIYTEETLSELGNYDIDQLHVQSTGNSFVKIKLLNLLNKLSKMSIRLSMYSIKNNITIHPKTDDAQYQYAMNFVSEMSKECRNLVSEVLANTLPIDNELAVSNTIVYVRAKDIYALEVYWKQFKHQDYKYILK